ncbi:hypothetical protein NQ315_015635 [Exocentrus adspersus]|uniref:C-type lectin domain-containing protein n=1 Tax=Exocentrus adspersus TaxID=1586481 RepID=A0AAV8W2F4_9CUCU|nr:hypothetical protein NQ315_015635 [Exocentrus adspersus]
MKLLVIVSVLALSCAQDLQEKQHVKRSYVCPPKFVRQGHRCYFFSKEPATWQDAHFKCRDMHSNIAIIKNWNQDKLLRSFLSKRPVALVERWLGGVYDWEQMAWKWAASGKPLSYNGFQQKMDKEDKEKLRWHCIIMDPALDYRWNSRSCVEQKHFICHTKLKIVSSKDKKKLRRQYKVDKDNKLNEIPVPIIPDYMTNNTTPLKSNIPISYQVEINNSLNDQALFAETAPVQERRAKKGRKKKRKTKYKQLTHLKRNTNGTSSDDKERRRKNREKVVDKGNPTSMQHIRWKTYKKEVKQANPLYPKPIVEEYNYVKEQ